VKRGLITILVVSYALQCKSRQLTSLSECLVPSVLNPTEQLTPIHALKHIKSKNQRAYYKIQIASYWWRYFLFDYLKTVNYYVMLRQLSGGKSKIVLLLLQLLIIINYY